MLNTLKGTLPFLNIYLPSLRVMMFVKSLVLCVGKTESSTYDRTMYNI